MTVQREKLRSHQFVFSVAQEVPAIVYILTDEWVQSDDFMPELLESLAARVW